VVVLYSHLTKIQKYIASIKNTLRKQATYSTNDVIKSNKKLCSYKALLCSNSISQWCAIYIFNRNNITLYQKNTNKPHLFCKQFYSYFNVNKNTLWSYKRYFQ